MRSLIVEDDLVCRQVLKKFLTVYGPCTAAVNGTEALALIAQATTRNEHFQLICLDIDMPDMTGHQVLTLIRTREDERQCPADQRVRVLMTSGHSQPEHVVLSFHNRCDGFLVKPITAHKLAERLNPFGFAPLSEGDYEPGAAAAGRGSQESSKA
jgi:two-component system, chemotaxis family, chemotaxis protein CheY